MNNLRVRLLLKDNYYTGEALETEQDIITTSQCG